MAFLPFAGTIAGWLGGGAAVSSTAATALSAAASATAMGVGAGAAATGAGAAITAAGVAGAAAGVGSAISAASGVAGIAGSVASVVSGIQQSAAIKKATKASQSQYDTSKSDLTTSLDQSGAMATAAATDKRRAIARSKSIFTNPLGIADQANTIRKSLLGQ